MKIIAFTFAGGNKYSFRKFRDTLPDFEIIEYRGRGARISEELQSDIHMIVDDVMDKIEEIIGSDDYVLYGHSMGALVAYLVARRIKTAFERQPSRLIVTGRKAPGLVRDKVYYTLEGDVFWEEVAKIGGVPAELLEYPELMDYYLPILKADFKSVENYIHSQGDVLEIPIDVFFGTQESITVEEAKEWKRESSNPVRVFSLEGDHFSMLEQDVFINYLQGIETGIENV